MDLKGRMRMTENEAIKIIGNNATEKEIILETLYQLVEKFNRGHWGDIQLFEDEENRYSTVIEKAIEEIQQYRAIGMVEEIQRKIDALKYDCTRYEEQLSIARGEKQVFTDDDMLLEEYRAIGTIEELKDLKEKNEPKKPIPNKPLEEGDYIKWACPNCGRIRWSGYYFPPLTFDKVCTNCLQAIDWQ